MARHMIVGGRGGLGTRALAQSSMLRSKALVTIPLYGHAQDPDFWFDFPGAAGWSTGLVPLIGTDITLGSTGLPHHMPMAIEFQRQEFDDLAQFTISGKNQFGDSVTEVLSFIAGPVVGEGGWLTQTSVYAYTSDIVIHLDSASTGSDGGILCGFVGRDSHSNARFGESSGKFGLPFHLKDERAIIGMSLGDDLLGSRSGRLFYHEHGDFKNSMWEGLGTLTYQTMTLWDAEADPNTDIQRSDFIDLDHNTIRAPFYTASGPYIRVSRHLLILDPTYILHYH